MKGQYPGVVLMFEVGYKCLLFEEDAEVLSGHSRSFSLLTRPLRLPIKNSVYSPRRRVTCPLLWSLWNVGTFT